MVSFWWTSWASFVCTKEYSNKGVGMVCTASSPSFHRVLSCETSDSTDCCGLMRRGGGRRQERELAIRGVVNELTSQTDTEFPVTMRVASQAASRVQPLLPHPFPLWEPVHSSRSRRGEELARCYRAKCMPVEEKVFSDLYS
ncbi:hypothetical protein HW555_010333 [Spodoptera exigua]|uniref:Uncharacterized protein n=1 Tax=Spodoptera exigua TaxID=7107 RepID=A0A835GAW7_SPOEX|nr:hypothetical protein HW555_010333 [Spodoptera exigua]